MQQPSGIRMRVMLVSALLLVISIVTAGSLLIVRDRVRQQAADALARDLARLSRSKACSTSAGTRLCTRMRCWRICRA